MASMQGRSRPSHKPKPHMLAGTLAKIVKLHQCSYLLEFRKFASIDT
jgi:hypothetical protein